jgi:hypothetical protein
MPIKSVQGTTDISASTQRPAWVDAVRERGFATLDPFIDGEQCEAVYQAFDSLLVALEGSRGNAIIASTAHFLKEFRAHHESEVLDETIQFSAARRHPSGNAMEAHHYFAGALSFASEKTPLADEVKNLWRPMDQVLRVADDNVLSRVRGQYSATEFHTILKVWKYTPALAKRYFIPPHYDRSVLTTILHTQNPGSERLLIGPPGDGTPIGIISTNFSNLQPHRPRAADFPLTFPGLHATHYFALFPTAHAVEQIEPGLRSSRYSLVYFLISRISSY